jgi:hypothetical protein
MEKIRFGELLVRQFQLQEPDVITTTTITSSKRNGATSQDKVVKKPFTLDFKVIPDSRDDFKYSAILGLRPADHPESPVSISIKETEDGKLNLSSSYQYTEKYQAYETKRTPVRYRPAGSQYAPYCYSTEGEWEYEEESVPVQREQTQTAKSEKLVDNQNTFNDVYRLLFTLSGQDPKFEVVLNHVEKAGKAFLAQAQKAVKGDMSNEEKSLKSQLAALSKKTRATEERLKRRSEQTTC